MASSDQAAARAVMRLSPADNVAVALRPLKAGETVMLDDVPITVGRNIAVGHKLAARAIEKGEIILKYSCPIGTATSRDRAGRIRAHAQRREQLPADVHAAAMSAMGRATP